MTDLHYLSATEALERFRARELSPVELLEAVIARAEEVEPTVNALCHTFYDEARAQAREAEARYAGKGEPPRPLEGIPLAVKEEEAIAGQPWTQGSLIYKDLVADAHLGVRPPASRGGRDRPRAHDRAGVLVRGLHPVAAVGRDAQPVEPGATRSAARPAARARRSRPGTTTLASGSDIGGSIRIPASFNGVVGFKPPYGRVPVDPPFNLDTYCHCGPMARTVADCALYENVVAGPDPSDIATLRPKLLLPERFEGVEGLRVALSVDLGDWPVDPEVRANTLAVGDALRAAGAIVDEVDLRGPARRRAARDRDPLRARVRRLGRRARSPEHGELLTAYAIEMARWCTELAAGHTFFEGLELEARLYAPVGALLEDYDALVCPTAGTRGLLADDDYVGHGLEVGGEQLEFYFERPAHAGVQRHEPLPGARTCRPASPTTACRPACRSPGARTTTRPCSASAPRSSASARGSTPTSGGPAVVARRGGMSALLEIEGLTARLPVEGELRTVLHDVSLTIGAGEAVGLVGESGSGKSMTARAIGRLLPAGAQTSGRGPVRRPRRARRCAARRCARYRERGRDDLPGPARAREPGAADRRLHDRGAAHAPASRAREAARATRSARCARSASTTASGACEQYPHELSGGLLQRVMIAAVLLGRARAWCWPTSRRPRST